MTALSADVLTPRYGTPDGHQPLGKALAANVTVYRGSVAALAGTGGAGVTGYLKNTSTVATTDIILGIIGNALNAPNTSAGIAGGSTAGAVVVNVETGTFILASGTGADALTVATNGATVYLIDEITVGATNGSSTRPVAGVQVASPTEDPSIPTGYVAVKLGTPTSPLGGP